MTTAPGAGYGPDGIDGATVGRQLGLISLAIGMGSLLTSWLPFVGAPVGAVAVVLGVVAIVKSVRAHGRVERAGRQPRTGGAFGLGLIGVITGALAFAISAALYAAGVAYTDADQACAGHERGSVEYQDCVKKELGD